MSQKISEYLESKFGPGHGHQNQLLTRDDVEPLLATGVTIAELAKVRHDLGAYASINRKPNS